MSDSFLMSARACLGDDCLAAQETQGEIVFDVPRARIAQVLRVLRDDPRTQTRQLMDICAVDRVKESEAHGRFEIVYQLLSLCHNARLTLRLAANEGESVPTVVPVFSSAGWFEREIFDLFGVSFEGHPDLRRILTDYEFEGHPLRRDFPLTGHYQVRYDELTGKVGREPVRLDEPFRAFGSSKERAGA